MERVKHPQKLGDRFHAADRFDLSVVVLFDGWPDDVLRLHASLARHVVGTWELVVVDVPVDDDASQQIATLDHVEHVPLRDAMGWAAARNLGLRLATGAIVAVVDTSVECTGDVLPPLATALSDDDVGVVGRWGVVSTDGGYTFTESDGPDVDGVEGYLIAARRSTFAHVGLFDPKFRWYRNADIDFSFQVRDRGYRTIVDPSIPVVRHTHRGWTAMSDVEREEASRRNFGRFRQHWGARTDLLQRPAPDPSM